MILGPRGGGSLCWLNPLVPCLVFTPGTISLQIWNPDYPQNPITDANPLPCTLYAPRSGRHYGLDWVISFPLNPCKYSLCQIFPAYILSLFSSLDLARGHKLQVSSQAGSFCLFAGLYGTAGMLQYKWRHMLEASVEAKEQRKIIRTWFFRGAVFWEGDNRKERVNDGRKHPRGRSDSFLPDISKWISP